MGLTKEEAFANPGSHLSSFFVYTPPRFRFNRSEQMLLHNALIGETSEEVAASLFISPWTVKSKEALARDLRAGRGCRSRMLLPPVVNSIDATSRGAERKGTCFIICDNTSENFVH